MPQGSGVWHLNLARASAIKASNMQLGKTAAAT